MTDSDVRPGEIDIPVTVHVALTEGWGGERWDVLSAIDERSGESIGDIGAYEFDAYSDFPETIMAAVLTTLREAGEFQAAAFYAVEIDIRDGGSSIGSASRYFRGPSTEEAENSA